MAIDRFAQLEQRLAQVEAELATSHRQIDQLRREGHRSRRFGRLAVAVSACGLVALLALTGGTASAGPPTKTLTVKAPFQVVDGSGVVIFSVTADKATGGGSAHVFAATGDPVAALQASQGGAGGELVVKGDVTGQTAFFGGNGPQLSLRFYQGVTNIGGIANTGKDTLLQLNDNNGKMMAKIANNGSSGTVAVYGPDGNPRVIMADSPDTGRGALDILGDNGEPAVTMKATAIGGYFAITNPAGTARVEAGVIDKDDGIVRTFGTKHFDFMRGT